MAHPVGKIIQPTAFGTLSLRRYGSFAGRIPPIVVPPVRITISGGGRSVTVAGGGRSVKITGTGGR